MKKNIDFCVKYCIRFYDVFFLLLCLIIDLFYIVEKYFFVARRFFVVRYVVVVKKLFLFYIDNLREMKYL